MLRPTRKHKQCLEHEHYHCAAGDWQCSCRLSLYYGPPSVSTCVLHLLYNLCNIQQTVNVIMNSAAFALKAESSRVDTLSLKPLRMGQMPARIVHLKVSNLLCSDCNLQAQICKVSNQHVCV